MDNLLLQEKDRSFCPLARNHLFDHIRNSEILHRPNREDD